MSDLIHIGFSISIICNYISIWFIHRYLRSQDRSIDALTKLVLAMAEKQFRELPKNVIPINLKKP